MTDYLHALVDRARGEARAVRPRPAPRFAPAPPADLEVEVEAPAAGPRAAVPPPAAAASIQPQARRRPTAAPPAAAPRAEPVGRAAQESVEPKPEARREPVEPPTPPPPQRAVHEQSEVERRKTVLVERHVVDEQAPPGAAPSAPIEITVERVSAAEPRREDAPVVLPPPVVAEAAFPAPRLDVVVEAPPLEEESRTVIVSIGRVEVNAERSSPPPSPVPASAWAGPRLSLDDYLRGRNEGRR